MLLQALIVDRGAPVAPIVYFEIGKANAERPERRAEAIDYLKQFIAATQTGSDVSVWDPYHTREHLVEAQQLLASFKTP